MKRSKNLIIIAILFLSIGFAAVATNLFINGNILVGTNDNNFDVIFTKSIIDSVDFSDTTISEDGKTITFNTRDLSKVGDKSILDFEVTNKSTQYDANVTINCVGGTNEGEYYTIIKNIPSIVVARSREKGKVEIELKKVTTENLSETFTCTLKVNATERTETAEQLCNVVTGDGTNVGDKIKCGSESFYVIKNDGENIRMLAEYNLMVGNIATYDTAWNVQPLTNAKALQDSSALGAVYKDNSWTTVKTRIGTTPFSNAGSTYTGSLAEGYVNEYKNNLEIMGLSVDEATLITKEELNEFGMIDNITNTLPGKEWLFQTSYWTKTAYSSDEVWGVYSAGGFGSDPWGYGHGFGVRPVISIPIDQI